MDLHDFDDDDDDQEESNNVEEEETEEAELSDDPKIQNAQLIHDLYRFDGILRSPINLNMSHMQVTDLYPLKWFNYSVMPNRVKVANTSRNAMLGAKWHHDRPFLTSGPLFGKYIFCQVHFHWGVNAMTGSEHQIDGGSMPMEIHAVHYKSDYFTLSSAKRKNDGVVIVVYLFKLQLTPNPLLKEVVQALPFIRQAHASVRLVPMLITTIVRPFENDYFLYWGSISTDATIHTVLWLVSREPIGISVEQIAEFRTLRNDKHELLLGTSQPVQPNNNRQVFYVCPGGSKYATLLPIPREPSTVVSEQGTVSDRFSQDS